MCAAPQSQTRPSLPSPHTARPQYAAKSDVYLPRRVFLRDVAALLLVSSFTLGVTLGDGTDFVHAVGEVRVRRRRGLGRGTEAAAA